MEVDDTYQEKIYEKLSLRQKETFGKKRIVFHQLFQIEGTTSRLRPKKWLNQSARGVSQLQQRSQVIAQQLQQEEQQCNGRSNRDGILGV